MATDSPPPPPIPLAAFPGGHGSAAHGGEGAAPVAGSGPERYVIRGEKRGAYLACLDLPEVQVRVERGASTGAAAARKAPEGTIFLDGAAQGEPFLDLDRRVYNLDHHEGCVRSFTLATCEQALVLALRGLDLREQPWTLRANEPDLDTVLALWVLLNARRLREDDGGVRRLALPLIRLEGAIDVHGLELQEVTGLPPALLAEVRGRLDGLRQRELKLKHAGRWPELDPLEYTAQQLATIDRLVYPPGHFAGLGGFEELAKAELGRDRIVVVCRAPSGIYEAERDLKQMYGRRLGLIVLQKDPATYTLRQVDHFLPVGLEAVYEKLNALDPAVTGGAHDRWGGSGEIGGSPRGTGTALSAHEIAGVCRDALRPPGLGARLAAALVAARLSAAPLAPAVLGALRPDLAGGGPVLSPTVIAAGLGIALALLAVLARRRGRSFGLHPPQGGGWLALLPAALAGALLGGAWSLGPGGAAHHGLAALLAADRGTLLAMLLLPALAEVAFRGLAHGSLVRRYRVQHPGGPWFVSGPVVLCTLLYVAWTAPLWTLAGTPAARLFAALAPRATPAAIAAFLLGAGLVGLATGMARERSASLLAPLLLHYAAVLAALAAWIV